MTTIVATTVAEAMKARATVATVVTAATVVATMATAVATMATVATVVTVATTTEDTRREEPRCKDRRTVELGQAARKAAVPRILGAQGLGVTAR